MRVVNFHFAMHWCTGVFKLDLWRKTCSVNFCVPFVCKACLLACHKRTRMTKTWCAQMLCLLSMWSMSKVIDDFEESFCFWMNKPWNKCEKKFRKRNLFCFSWPIIKNFLKQSGDKTILKKTKTWSHIALNCCCFG